MSIRPETYVVPYGVNAQYPIIKDGSVLKLVNELGEDIEVIATGPGTYPNPTKTLVTKACLTGIISDKAIDIFNCLREGAGDPMKTPNIAYTFTNPSYYFANNYQAGFTFPKSPLYDDPRITGNFRFPLDYDKTRPTKATLYFSSSLGAGGQVRFRLRIQRMSTATTDITPFYDDAITFTTPPNYAIESYLYDLPLNAIDAGEWASVCIERYTRHVDDTYTNPVYLVAAEINYNT